MCVYNLFEILKDIVRIPSPSGDEQELSEYIKETYCRPHGWTAEIDDVFNLYICRNDDNGKCHLPLLNAHLDTHPRGDNPENRIILRKEDFLRLDENSNVVKTHEIQAGFDDKAGIASVIYLMIYTNFRFRALFAVQEEWAKKRPRFGRQGGGGIDHALMKSFQKVFKHASYVITLDRGGGRDIITEYGETNCQRRPRVLLCENEFRDWLLKCSNDIGYPMKVAEGRIGDSYNIRRTYEGLNCVNLSCGVYNEHQSSESININETLGVTRVVSRCLEIGY